MMKKWICALLTVALVISVCAFAMAETGHFTVNGAGSYSNLKDAVAAASASINGTTTIKLEGGDLEGCAVSIPSGFANLIIDFGGHTYTATEPFAGSAGTETQAMQLLKDSNITLQNGRLRGKQNSANGLKMMIQNYANLTLKDFTVDASSLPAVQYVCSNNNGNVRYTGNTSILAAKGKVAFDVCGFSTSATYPGPTVTVDTTGTIDGIVEYSYNSQHGPSNVKLVIKKGDFTGTFNQANDPKGEGIQISGGNYAKQPSSDYVKAGLVVKNSNSTTPYHIGADAEAAIANAEAGSTLTVLKGSAITNVPAGVKVENKTGDKITVNNEVVNPDASVVIPTPAVAPKTGDSTPIALYVLCAALAVACAAWMAKRRKA